MGIRTWWQERRILLLEKTIFSEHPSCSRQSNLDNLRQFNRLLRLQPSQLTQFSQLIQPNRSKQLRILILLNKRNRETRLPKLPRLEIYKSMNKLYNEPRYYRLDPPRHYEPERALLNRGCQEHLVELPQGQNYF
jgi:hypothetical protein